MPRIANAGPNSYGFQLGPAVIGTSHGRFGPEAFEAVGVLRKLVGDFPTLAEARLRLGRVLWQLDRWTDAEAEFQRLLAYTEPAVSQWTYLAGLFYGQLLEERGRHTEAKAAYERADAVFSGQSARLRLYRLSVHIGEPLPASFVSSLGSEEGLDPWSSYFAGTYGAYGVPQELARLRMRLAPGANPK